MSETCTTISCSSCRRKECYNKCLPCQEPKKAAKNRKIHGLKQCTHCSKLWNRDFNAACNILYAFFGYYFNNKRPSYLKKLGRRHDGTSSSAMNSLSSSCDSTSEVPASSDGTSSSVSISTGPLIHDNVSN